MPQGPIATEEKQVQIIEWSNDYVLGIAEIDDQHRALVGMINALDASTHADYSAENMRKMLDELNAYVRDHFAFEERLMAGGGCTQELVTRHCGEHAYFRSVLRDLISMDAPKTKTVATLMHMLTNGESALLLLPDRNETVEKSARNLQHVKALRANYLNIRDLLGYSKIVMPLAALDVVSGFLETDEASEWVLIDDGDVAAGSVEG